MSDTLLEFHIAATSSPNLFNPAFRPRSHPSPYSPAWRLPPASSTSSPTTVSALPTKSIGPTADHLPCAEKGEVFDLNQLRGKTILVVNTASKCGFTPQFDGLEKLYKEVVAKYPERFTVLGFPCNQFGGQDPGSDDDIQSFCRVNYGVSFPVLQKVEVNGDKAAPVWEWMKKERPGLMGMKRIKWNFEKFLVGADGQVKGRWASTTKPDALKAEILKELEKGGSGAPAKTEL